jgi:hypothetical protein
MSIEQLLLFLLLVAIPLLQRLIRGIRARTGGSPWERGPAAAEGVVTRPRPALSVPDRGGTASEGRRTELPLPDSPLLPVLPHAARHAAPEQLRASERAPGLRRERQRGPAAVRAAHLQPPTRPGTALQRVIAGGDLRRAIVLIAILGPCRALEPLDAPPLG